MLKCRPDYNHHTQKLRGLPEEVASRLGSQDTKEAAGREEKTRQTRAMQAREERGSCAGSSQPRAGELERRRVLWSHVQ